MEKHKNYGLIQRLLSLLNADKCASEEENETSLSIKEFIEEIPGGFFIYRADGNEEILYANKAVWKIFGCDDLNEFMSFTGGTFKGIVHPDDLDAVEKSISEQIHVSKDDLDYVEYRIIRKDGEVRWVEDYGHIIRTESGNVFYVFITDATKRIEEAFLQERKQKQILQDALNAAKAADVAKNSFLSNMSHDMRTPLNAIFGYTALAKKNISDEKAVCDYLDKIERSGKSILELIVKVLEFSYTESHEASLNEEKCSVGGIVSEVVSAVSPRAERKHITLSLNFESVRHDFIYADAEKLKHSLTYITNNAVKYTGNGGKVDVSVSEKENASLDTATYIFTVTDNGMGIRKETLPHIFEPFLRENNTTLSGEFGTGLGLTIVKRYVNLMGGTVTAESEVGKGSTFTVTLGFKTVNNEKSSDFLPKCDFSGKKILLVEDNEINLEIETEILEDLGFTVDSAVNGKIAVEKISAAEKDEYSLVLMDIQMPIMDGRQAAKAIRALPDASLANIPIVALSANAFESDRRASLEVGMNEHLPKPIDIDVFIKTVGKIFGNR